MIHLGLRGTKADTPWSIRARYRVWLGHRSEPQIVASLRRKHAEQSVSPFDVLRRRDEETRMENILARCAGLDAYKDSIEVYVRRIEPNGRVHSETRHWGTMTRDLLEMAAWLAAEGVTNVAMESTGAFWKPIFNILESRFTVLLVNARHLKQVRGARATFGTASGSRNCCNVDC